MPETFFCQSKFVLARKINSGGDGDGVAKEQDREDRKDDREEATTTKRQWRQGRKRNTRQTSAKKEGRGKTSDVT